MKDYVEYRDCEDGRTGEVVRLDRDDIRTKLEMPGFVKDDNVSEEDIDLFITAFWDMCAITPEVNDGYVFCSLWADVCGVAF